MTFYKVIIWLLFKHFVFWINKIKQSNNFCFFLTFNFRLFGQTWWWPVVETLFQNNQRLSMKPTCSSPKVSQKVSWSLKEKEKTNCYWIWKSNICYLQIHTGTVHIFTLMTSIILWNRWLFFCWNLSYDLGRGKKYHSGVAEVCGLPIYTHIKVTRSDLKIVNF